MLKNKIILLTGLLLALTACEKKNPVWEYMPDMFDSTAFKAQKEDVNSPNGAAARMAPEGTVSRNFQGYHYTAADTEKAGRELKNPIPRTHEALARGQKLFNVYCIVCHGSAGTGNGNVVPPYPRPPSLLSDKVVKWPDGSIFNVITRGQNLMPSYASQMAAEDRWMVIHYIRALQRADNPQPEDLKKLKKAEGSNS